MDRDNRLKRDSVHRTLKKQINSGFLMPGTRLIELQLAERFEVSRTIIREVIKQMAVEGLVDLVPYKGAAVAKTSIKDLEEIYRIQQDLEGLAAYLATPRLSDGDISELEKIHLTSREHIHGHAAGWQKWNMRFHKFFLENCGNKRLVKLIESHRDQFARYWFLLLSIPGCIEKNMGQHEGIIDAVKARDPALVRDLMEKHIGDGANQLLDIIKKAYPSSFTI